MMRVNADLLCKERYRDRFEKSIAEEPLCVPQPGGSTLVAGAKHDGDGFEQQPLHDNRSERIGRQQLAMKPGGERGDDWTAPHSASGKSPSKVRHAGRSKLLELEDQELHAPNEEVAVPFSGGMHDQ
jgi:hypothetical protein